MIFLLSIFINTVDLFHNKFLVILEISKLKILFLIFTINIFIFQDFFPL